jgi:uridylate kinase
MKFEELTYMETLKKRLSVMDNTAISLCMDNDIPIIVFNFKKKGNLLKIISGEKVGSIVRGD